MITIYTHCRGPTQQKFDKEDKNKGSTLLESCVTVVHHTMIELSTCPHTQVSTYIKRFK